MEPGILPAEPSRAPRGTMGELRLSIFIASSLDNYIATTDGRIDWLTAAAANGEDYGYDTFMRSVDALAMGRNTYDFIAEIDPLPFGGKPVFVFTHQTPSDRDGVTFWDISPQEACSRWSEQGIGRVYVDGGFLISSFLGEGLIDDMTLTKVPLLLGSGRPLFHAVSRQNAFRLIDVQSFPSGMVSLTYERR